MGQGYFRNTDDSYSDPDNIATNYKVGRNAFFEVLLTLDELNEKIVPNTGGTQGSPAFIAATSGFSGGGVGCPEINEHVWLDKKNTCLASELIGKEGKIALYNPLTGNSNELKGATLLKDVYLYRTRTKLGVEFVSSGSHTVIRNTQDMTGLWLSKMKPKDECLTYDGEIKNIFFDEISTIEFWGTGSVVEIKLHSEYLYVSGTTPKLGQLAHNLKPPPF